MNLPLRSASGALALLAGLFGIAACGSSSPAATPSVAIASTSSAAPTTGASSPSVLSVSEAVSGESGQPSATSAAPPAGTATTLPAATTSSAAATSTSAASSAQHEVNPAGDIPDNQAFVPYMSSAGKFTVTVPEGWARTNTATGVMFTDKYNSIEVDTRHATSAPTAASLRTSEVPMLTRSEANFVLGDITTITRNAETAVLLTYHADTPANAVTGKVATAAFERYVFFKSGTEAVITVGAPVGGDNVDPWRTVTDSFSWSA